MTEPKTEERSYTLEPEDSAIVAVVRGGVKSADVSLEVIGNMSSFQFYGIAELIRHQATKMMAKVDMMELVGQVAEAQQSQQLAQKLGLIKGGRKTN